MWQPTHTPNGLRKLSTVSFRMATMTGPMRKISFLAGVLFGAVGVAALWVALTGRYWMQPTDTRTEEPFLLPVDPYPPIVHPDNNASWGFVTVSPN